MLNLLSKRIVKADGSPGENNGAALQYHARDLKQFQLTPPKTPYVVLPPALVGGTATPYVCEGLGINDDRAFPTEILRRMARKSPKQAPARCHCSTGAVSTHGVIGAAAFRPRCMPPSLALWLIPRRTIVDQYVALDVSLQKTAVCVLNVSGRVLIEADVPSGACGFDSFHPNPCARCSQGWIGKRGQRHHGCGIP